jgi:dephospho-CoA kinase
MIVIGLTGSIGMGKTTAANMLGHMGYPVHDADGEVHKLLGPGGAAVPFVAAAFPDSYERKTGRIDRHKLGQTVFDDPEKRRYLESILHPLVRRAQKRFLYLASRSGARAAILDVPLLFEYGVYKSCDMTICVSAPAFLQKLRVLSRPGMTDDKFRARLKSQLPDIEKRRMADYVVQTGCGKADTYRQLQKIMTSIQKKKESA